MKMKTIRFIPLMLATMGLAYAFIKINNKNKNLLIIAGMNWLLALSWLI